MACITRAAQGQDCRARRTDGGNRRWWGYTWTAANEQEGAVMTNQYEPFDLERALAGEPVILRGGQKAYVRHYEKTLILRRDGRPLLGYRLYDGLAVEASWGSDGLWLSGREFPKDIVGMYPQYRLVNGVKVPVFPDWEPALGETVFVVDVTHAQFFYEQEWIGDELDLMYLDRGLVYPATTGGECAAELHTKEMHGLVPGEMQYATI